MTGETKVIYFIWYIFMVHLCLVLYGKGELVFSIFYCWKKICCRKYKSFIVAYPEMYLFRDGGTNIYNSYIF